MQHLWPFSIATLEQNVMVVQYTAMELSPLGHVRTTLHRRLSLVGRAYGIAYLAFCSSIERHHLARAPSSTRIIRRRKPSNLCATGRT
jgi:hypothetical protein